MKIRKAKKNIKSIIDNAHDVAVMRQVLLYILRKLKGKDAGVLPENPFNDKDLNMWFYFVWAELNDKCK